MSPRRVCSGVLTALGLAGPVALAAQVTVEASARQFTVGDRVQLDLTVVHAPDDSIAWPEITDPMGSFEVLEAEAVRPTIEDGRQRSVLRLTLTAFEIGDLEFPSMTVAVVAPDGARQVEFDTDPLPLEVVSVGLDESGEIRDIKPPLSVPRDWLLALPWVLAVLAAAGAGYWAYRRFRQRRRSPLRSPGPAAPARPPHEIALEAFARLRASPMLERGEIKQYFVDASEILRRYVEARFGVEAMELPSPDILGGLRTAGTSFEVHERFREFFDQTDLVKFAKYRPAAPRAAEIVTLGEEIVGATIPPAEPAPSVASDSAVVSASVGQGGERP